MKTPPAYLSRHDNAAPAAQTTEAHMKARTIILTVTAAALVAAPAILVAQHGPGGGPAGFRDGGPTGHGMLRMLPRLADKLELTQAQRDQIHAIIEDGKPELEALRDQSAAAREQFHETTDFGNFDETAYRSFFESQAQLHVEMQLIGAQMVSHVFVLLTPEQRQELLDLIELIKPERHGSRRAGGKRFGPQ
jgi:Spy/CpxP family protein refolding chaperone